MKIFFTTYLIFGTIFNFCYSQNQNITNNSEHRIMFYNVENYFDAEYDSSIIYNEFTPNGDLHWTNNKYLKKRNSIYKVIVAVGGWKPVALIGLAEIENEYVIKDLINSTPLKKQGYGYVHYESKDFRGIDVALIYHTKSFKVLFSKPIVISDPLDLKFTTRDMLYVKGLLGSDTLHIIVNHWTSRYRGYLESEPYRIMAAQILLNTTDSICAINHNANIILLGDFNDNHSNKSMQLVTNKSDCSFYNMNLLTTNSNVGGTLKYKSEWSNFDQFIISNALVVGNNGIICLPDGYIFDADYLLEPDLKYFGLKTNRTNIGYKYHGGFSDHLPIYIDVITGHK